MTIIIIIINNKIKNIIIINKNIIKNAESYETHLDMKTVGSFYPPFASCEY